MKLICKLFGHSWSMYRGHAQLHPHSGAFCLRCGVRYRKEKI